MEEEEEEEVEEVGLVTELDFTGFEAKDKVEDLVEGGLDASGDLARLESFLEDGGFLASVLTVFRLFEESSDRETTFSSGFTFKAEFKSGLCLTRSLLLVLSFSSFILFDSNKIFGSV